jgi:hypothetical protein
MLKFIGTVNDRPTLGLGLSDDNIILLKEGRPILLHLSEAQLPYDLQILIFHGATEQSMIDELNKHGTIIDTPAQTSGRVN